MTSTTIHCPKSEAIAVVDAHLNNVGLPTYSEMFSAIEHLSDNCWLDSDPCETKDLGEAKERARKVYEAAWPSFVRRPASES